jgi:hypothetical protein
MEDLEDDGWLGNEPDDAHPLAATAEKRIDLVDASDELGPRFPAGCKPGTVGSRGVERFVFRRDLDEDLTPSRGPSPPEPSTFSRLVFYILVCTEFALQGMP